MTVSLIKAALQSIIAKTCRLYIVSTQIMVASMFGRGRTGVLTGYNKPLR